MPINAEYRGPADLPEVWNPVPNASSKDGANYRALFCDSCGKNYTHGHVRMAKEPVLV